MSDFVVGDIVRYKHRGFYKIENVEVKNNLAPLVRPYVLYSLRGICNPDGLVFKKPQIVTYEDYGWGLTGPIDKRAMLDEVKKRKAEASRVYKEDMKLIDELEDAAQKYFP